MISSTISSASQKLKLMDRDSATATLQMILPLYLGGKITSIVNQSSLGKEIAQEEYKRCSLPVVRDIKRYYYAVKLTHWLTALGQIRAC